MKLLEKMLHSRRETAGTLTAMLLTATSILAMTQSRQVHSRFSDVFKTLLKASKAPTDCRLLTCISPHGVYLSISLSLSPCCELYNYRNSAAPFIATNTGVCPGKSHQYLMNQNNWLVTGRVFEGSLKRKLPFIFRYFNAHSSQHF